MACIREGEGGAAAVETFTACGNFSTPASRAPSTIIRSTMGAPQKCVTFCSTIVLITWAASTPRRQTWVPPTAVTPQV